MTAQALGVVVGALLLGALIGLQIDCSSNTNGESPCGSHCGGAPSGGGTSTGGGGVGGQAGGLGLGGSGGSGGSTSGELVIEQISIPSMFNMGEAALIVGPDGTSVLIDTGNDGHEHDVRAAIDRRLGQRAVDWLVLTHYHGDHDGAVDKLFDSGPESMDLNRGLVSRGLYDMDADEATSPDTQQLCNLREGPAWEGRVYDLCSGPVAVPCDGDDSDEPWPASGCPGLLLGNLETPADDGAGQASYIELGGGARLTFFHANGWLVQNGGLVDATAHGVVLGLGTTEGENSRCLGGVLAWGDFRYTFNGDLTGAGDKVVPDMEGFIAARAAGIVNGPGGIPLVPDGRLDVAKLSHHGYKSSTQQPWVDWLLPGDGQSRNAVVGVNNAYPGAPASDVVDRVGARIGEGRIWLTQPPVASALLPHPPLMDAHGAAVVRVRNGGASYDVFAHTDAGEQEAMSYTSTP